MGWCLLWTSSICLFMYLLSLFVRIFWVIIFGVPGTRRTVIWLVLIFGILNIWRCSMYRKRHKMSRRSSRRSFTKGARNVRSRNYAGNPMRGGIRL